MEFFLVPLLLRAHCPLDLSNVLQVYETFAVVDPFRQLLLQVVGVVHWLQLLLRLLRFLLVAVVVEVVLLLLRVLILRLLHLDLLVSETSWLDLCELLHAAGSESSDAELT